MPMIVPQKDLKTLGKSESGDLELCTDPQGNIHLFVCERYIGVWNRNLWVNNQMAAYDRDGFVEIQVGGQTLCNIKKEVMMRNATGDEEMWPDGFDDHGLGFNDPLDLPEMKEGPPEPPGPGAITITVNNGGQQ